MTKENKDLIYPILMTAKVEVDMMGTEAGDVLDRYRELAVALCRHTKTDVDSRMTAYDTELKEFVMSEDTAKPFMTKEIIGEFMHGVLDMCQNYKNPKKVLRFINTAYEILEINEPKYATY